MVIITLQYPFKQQGYANAGQNPLMAHVTAETGDAPRSAYMG